MDNKFFYKGSNDSKISGFFNIYQSKNGLIWIQMGNSCTKLTHKQIGDLNIDVFGLADFDYDDYKEAYNEQE
jgi:hypothetical protein